MTARRKTKGSTNKPLGYKYWVAFEVRCLETDKRIFNNHLIFRSNPVECETDLESIEHAFKEDYENGNEFKFKITLTGWPHLLGREPIPQAKPKNQPIQKEEPRKAPVLQLVVNNKDKEEIAELTT